MTVANTSNRANANIANCYSTEVKNETFLSPDLISASAQR